VKLTGFAIAPGRVLGRAFVFRRALRQVPFRHLEAAAASRERERLQTAFRAAQGELVELRARLSREAGEAHAYLFDAQILMLQDPLFAGRSLTLIEERLIGAEWALSIVCDELRRLFARASAVISERSHDLDDVLDRVLALLGGTKGDLVLPEGEKVVLVCEDLKPSEAAEIDWSRVGALVADHGSPTHHMAILAKSRLIPCVLGVRTATAHVASEAVVLVDGDAGFIDTSPPPSTRIEPLREARRAEKPEGPVHTEDGAEVVLRANIEFPSDIEAVRESGAMGIGLFRSEYLLSRNGRAPSEDTQLEIYRRLALAVAPHPLTVRTFDLGPEDLSPASPSSPNPALGLRAFRLLSRGSEYFRSQIRALLRAADEVAIRILFPFVGGVAEAQEILTLVEELEGELHLAGRAFRRPPLGAMIEIPSAAWSRARSRAGSTTSASAPTTSFSTHWPSIAPTRAWVIFMPRSIPRWSGSSGISWPRRARPKHPSPFAERWRRAAREPSSSWASVTGSFRWPPPRSVRSAMCSRRRASRTWRRRSLKPRDPNRFPRSLSRGPSPKRAALDEPAAASTER
jgi:phosphoenolpyruvate-protein phosphotransferase (PTS system enzyme I)